MVPLLKNKFELFKKIFPMEEIKSVSENQGAEQGENYFCR